MLKFRKSSKSSSSIGNFTIYTVFQAFIYYTTQSILRSSAATRKGIVTGKSGLYTSNQVYIIFKEKKY